MPTVYFVESVSRITSAALRTAMAVPALIGVAVFVKTMAPHAKELKSVIQPSTELPVSCSAGQSLTLSEARFVGAGTAIDAKPGCQLHIKDSEISADVVVDADSGVRITVERSVLRGKAEAIRMAVGGKLTLRGGALLEAEGTAVRMGTAGNIDAQDAKLTAREVGVSVDNSSTIDLERVEILSDGIAVQATNNLALRAKGSLLRGEKTAVAGERNARVSVGDCRVEGGVEAFRFTGKPAQMSMDPAQVTGALAYDGAPNQTGDPSRNGASAKPAKPQGKPAVRAPATANAASKTPPFNAAAAADALDKAEAQAEAQCRTSDGQKAMLWVASGFRPDGSNGGAQITDAKWRGSPEAECVLGHFRAVRIAAFDADTLPSGMGRAVHLQ